MPSSDPQQPSIKSFRMDRSGRERTDELIERSCQQAGVPKLALILLNDEPSIRNGLDDRYCTKLKNFFSLQAAGLDSLDWELRASLISGIFNLNGDVIHAAYESMLHFSIGELLFQDTPRAPSNRAATAEVRLEWFKTMVELRRQYSSDFFQSETLAVLAGEIGGSESADATRQAMDLWRCGKRPEDSVGRFLGHVISAGGDTGENVRDTLMLILQDRHPTASWGGHVPRALWSTNCAKAESEMLRVLCESSDDLRRVEIFTAALETGSQATATVVRLLANTSEYTPLPNQIAEYYGRRLRLNLMPGDAESSAHNETIVMFAQHVADALDLIHDDRMEEIEIDSENPDHFMWLLRVLASVDVEKMFQFTERMLREDLRVEVKREIVETISRFSLPKGTAPTALSLWKKLLVDQDLHVASWAAGWSCFDAHDVNVATALPELLNLERRLRKGFPDYLPEGFSIVETWDIRHDLSCRFARWILPYWQSLLPEQWLAVWKPVGRSMPKLFEDYAEHVRNLDASDPEVRSALLATFNIRGSEGIEPLFAALSKSEFVISDIEVIWQPMKSAYKDWIEILILLDASVLWRSLVSSLLWHENEEYHQMGCRCLNLLIQFECDRNWCAEKIETMLQSGKSEVRRQGLRNLELLVDQRWNRTWCANQTMAVDQRPRKSLTDKMSLKKLRERLPNQLLIEQATILNNNTEPVLAKKYQLGDLPNWCRHLVDESVVPVVKRMEKSQAVKFQTVSHNPGKIRRIITAWARDEVNDADLIVQWCASVLKSHLLREMTTPWTSNKMFSAAGNRQDELANLLLSFSRTIVERELKREDDKPDESTPVVPYLRSIFDTSTFLQLLAQQNKKKWAKLANVADATLLKRSWVRTRLTSICLPSVGQDFDEVLGEVRNLYTSKSITREGLLQLAVIAPVWCELIGEVLSIDELRDAVMWLSIHGEYFNRNILVASDHSADQSIWSTNNPFTALHLASDKAAYSHGANPASKYRTIKAKPTVSSKTNWIVDVRWFNRVLGQLDPVDLNSLVGGAKCLCAASRHKNLVDAIATISGQVDRQSILEAIETNDTPNPQDIVKLGLCPVLAVERDEDLARRSRIINQQQKKAKKLRGKQKENLLEACKNASATLATVGGLVDPGLFAWLAYSDLQERIDDVSPLSIDNVTLSLVVQANGVPVLEVEKSGTKQKSIPRKLRKHRDVLLVTELLSELKGAARDTARTLQTAMVRGTKFEYDQLRQLLDNLLVSRALQSTVLTQLCDDKIITGLLSRLEDGSLVLSDSAEFIHPLVENAPVQITHPFKMNERGDLKDWREFFADRVQPFEQVYRKIYAPTKAELGESLSKVTRFAQCYVRLDQCRAIVASLGWNTAQLFSKRLVHKRDNTTRIASCIQFGVSLSSDDRAFVESVTFFSPDGPEMALKDVPGQLFSETIRQVDQMVSAAVTHDQSKA